MRGAGFVTGMIARLGGLPPSAEKAAVNLTVLVEGDRERWVRSFGSHELRTVQWERDGLLIEQFPMLRLGIELELRGDTIHHIVRRCWVGAIPMPLALAPQIETTAQGTPLGWRLHVRVALPLLGRLIEYEGELVVG